MTRRQQLSLALLMPVTLALVGLLGAAFAQPLPEISVTTAGAQHGAFYGVQFDAPQFDVARAQANAMALAALAPDRQVGTPGNARAREWLVQQFQALSLTVETLPFSVTLGYQAQAGVHVWATVPGDINDILLITAPYDTGPAQSDTLPVATLLELARVMPLTPQRHTLVFLTSDSSAYGPSWGAKTFSEQFPLRRNLVTVLALAGPTPALIAASEAGLWNGAVPLELRSATTSHGLDEFFERALPFHLGEAAMYLHLGQPALTVSAAAGPAAEILLRRLDLAAPTSESVNRPYWRVSATHYLDHWVTPLLQLVWFVPLWVLTFSLYRRNPPHRDELQPETFALLGVAIIGLDGYAVAYSLVAARVLPPYELFPAAPGDPFLTQPTAWVVLAIYGTMAFFGWYTFKRGGWGRFADLLNLPYRQVTLLLWLSGFVLLTWLVNGFTAVVALGLPAYLWPWIAPRKTLPGKLANTVLALVGCVPLLLGLGAQFGNAQLFGPAWWFFPIAAAYGFFPFFSVLGFILFLALGVRFLRHGWRER